MNQIIDPKVSSLQAELLLAEGLRKSYGPRQALQGLSFSLKAGRVLGFLGPNGAGKTTSIRILTTMLEPESGYFIVDGIGSEYPEKIRRKIGVLPENMGFPKQMTGIEYLTYFGQLYGRKKEDAKAYGLKLLEEVGMQQRGKSLIGSYSHGMRQRIGIARALVNNPVSSSSTSPPWAWTRAASKSCWPWYSGLPGSVALALFYAAISYQRSKASAMM